MRSEIQVLPKLFLERLRKLIPSWKFDAIANIFSVLRPTTFRINSLKTSRNSVKESLENLGFRLQPVSWYPDAFVLKNSLLKEFQKTEIYKRGEIYIQSLSSMIPPLVLNPQPNENILDLTAAPGSKTTQIASLMKGEGRILANENDKIRFEKLKANVLLQGAGNVELLRGFGESIGKKSPESFDRVLLDAPCSAEGRFHIYEPASYRYWNLKKVLTISKIQKKLLFSAISALKKGGTLVYSTCTFSPEENEEIINEALIHFGNSLHIESIKLSIPNQMVGLTSWEGKSFHESLKKTVRILPTPEMEGFFVARLVKKT